MAIKDGYRVRQLVSGAHAGTDPLPLTAVNGYNTFASLGVDVEFFYSLEASGGTAWEYGIGVISSGQLARNVVLGSSNNNNAIVLPAGTHEVTNGPIPGKATGNIDLLGYTEAVITPTFSSGSLTIDLSLGTVFTYTYTSAITSITVSNAPAGKASSFTLNLIVGAGTPALTIPSAWKFTSTPTPSTIANECNRFVVDYDGTTWRATYGKYPA